MKKSVIQGCLLLAAILTITWFGCQKIYNRPGLNFIDGTATSNLSIEEKVTASVKGRIFDENGKPANAVTIKASSATTVTDINGFFQLNNVQLSKFAGTISIEKTGYFKINKTFLSTEGSTNYTEARLTPRVLMGSFNAGFGGQIYIEKSNVVFPANGVVTAATNITYVGSVNVFAAYLDPSNSITNLTMPGNLTGLDTSGKLTLMRSLGMLAVELIGSNGEKLQLASGKNATITLAIPNSLIAYAPSTIPLWYFNDTLGLWKQQGSATKQGNNYVGNVPHFSFWNCDVSETSITVKMNFKSQNGQPLLFTKVELTNTTNKSTRSDYTDSSGTISGIVPSSVPFALNVYDECGSIILTKTIGPFTKNTDLGAITANVGNTTSVTINGSLTNCAGAAVTNGFAEILLDGNIYRSMVDNNGKYAIVINRCNNLDTKAAIIGFDNGTSQQGKDTTWLNIKLGAYSAGSTKACGSTYAEYLSLSINGAPYFLYTPTDSLSFYNNTTSCSISGSTKSAPYTSVNFGLSYSSTAVIGPAIVTNFSFTKLVGANVLIFNGNNLSAAITEFGNNGGYIAGSFFGDVRDSLSTTGQSKMNGTFRVKR